MPSEPLSKWEYGVSCIKAPNAFAESSIFIALTSVLAKKVPSLFCFAQCNNGAVLYEIMILIF